MKMDKETVIKHRFWFLLPASVLFLLICLFCVISVRGDTEKNWAAARATDGQVKAIIGKRLETRNQEWKRQMSDLKLAAQKKRLELWQDMYDQQNQVERDPMPEKPAGAANAPATAATDAGGMALPDPRGGVRKEKPLITWPSLPFEWRVAKTNLHPSKLSYGEALGIVPDEYKQAYSTNQQFDEMIDLVDPLNEARQTGSVRFLGSGNTRANALAMLEPVRLVPGRPVASYEAWWLQEDVMLKRKMLETIADGNNAIGHLQGEWRVVSLPDGPKAGRMFRQNKKPATPAGGQPNVANAGGATTPMNPPAGAAAANPATPPMPPPTDPNNPDAKPEGDGEKKPPSPPAVDRKRFYNVTWLRGEKEAKDKPEGLAEGEQAMLAWWEGWELDIELVKIDAGLVLNGTSTNLSPQFKIPSLPLQIFFDAGTSDEMAESVIIADAGDLEANTNDAKGKNARDIKALPVPKGAKRIARVQRVPDKSRNVRDHQRFYNPNWLVDVQLVPGQGGSAGAIVGALHNRSGRRMLPARFEVTMLDDRGNSLKQEVRLEKNERMNAGVIRGFVRQEITRAQPPKKIVSVRQVFDWQTVPIKQINALRIGLDAHRHSDRTRVQFLAAYDYKKKDPSAPAPGAASATEATGTGPGGAPGPGVAGVGGGGEIKPGSMGGGSGAQKESKSDNHSLPLNRYYEITDEVRRVPIAVVVICDMSSLNEVLTAFANSPLRVQVTQAVWNRVPSLPRPNFAKGADKPAGASGTPAGGPGVASQGSGAASSLPGYPGRPSGGSSGGIVPTGSGSGSAPGPIASRSPTEDEATQIELQIYGLATVYESPEAWRRLRDTKPETPVADATTPAADPNAPKPAGK